MAGKLSDVPPLAAPGNDTSSERPVGPVDDDGSEPLSGRRKFFLTAGVLFAIATFGVWIYALFFYDPGRMIDELPDPAFPNAAEEICHQARVKIEALPTAAQTTDHADRADVVDEANDALRTMTAELATIVPQGEGKVTSGIEEWVKDWNVFIADRQEYADSLRNDPSTRFTESLKANRQVSRAIDAFAQVNRMESCTVPGDVG